MSSIAPLQDLVFRGKGGGTIVFVVMDGLGGLPDPKTGLTELESASTPNLDALARRSSLGSLMPVGPGITPGSGPGHLALFGYDPVSSMVGRGVLSALGVGFDLQAGDVAARINLATVDGDQIVLDRRAGRISDNEGRRVVEKVSETVKNIDGVDITLIHEKEHRAVLIMRGEGLGMDVTETDPQLVGLKMIEPEASGETSVRTASVVKGLLDHVEAILADESVANAFLVRGFGIHSRYPSFEERYGLNALAVAKYPMYRGVAKLVGMEIAETPTSNEQTVETLETSFGNHDFYFLHFKDTDTRGHDEDFAGKMTAIEEIDSMIPRIMNLNPDVLVITGDHATPTLLGEHSWHHVPTMIHSKWTRPSSDTFGETSCRTGDLDVFYGTDLMPLVLAHSLRLNKYGA
ncbi:MAG: 2,3-bisphosphoglycerate-independent phosphoglycerate mutase [bacterium]